MCRLKRNSLDPLLRKFLDIYGLHLLSNPRFDIDVGQVVIRQGKSSVTARSIAEFLDGDLGNLKVRRGESMAEVKGQLSSTHDVKTGLGISKAFLKGLGAVGVGAKLETRFASTGQVALSFRFKNPLLDSIDPILLGARLIQRKFNTTHPLYNNDTELFIISSVARSSSIDMILQHQIAHDANAAVELEGIIDANSAVNTEKLDDSTWRFSGTKALGFGVQLFSLQIDKNGRMRMELPEAPVKVRSDIVTVGEHPKPAILDGPDGSPFLEIS